MDIQGVTTKEKFLFTDPQVHSNEGSGDVKKYGTGNLVSLSNFEPELTSRELKELQCFSTHINAILCGMLLFPAVPSRSFGVSLCDYLNSNTFVMRMICWLSTPSITTRLTTSDFSPRPLALSLVPPPPTLHTITITAELPLPPRRRCLRSVCRAPKYVRRGEWRR